MKKKLLLIPLLALLAILLNPEGFLNFVLRSYWGYYGAEFKQIKTENYSIGFYHADGGHEQTILLLHGLGGKAGSSWFTVLPELSAKYNIVAPDLLLANLVEGNMSGYTLEQDERLISELMHELKLEKVSLAGLSVGGWLAARLALKHPDQCEKLVLIDSAGLDTESLLKSIAAHKDDFGIWFYNNIFYPKPPVPNFLVSPMLKDMDKLGPLCEELLRKNIYAAQALESVLPGIKCPTLILWGAEDRIISNKAGRRFYELIPDSSIVVLQDCGHAAVWDARHELPAIIGSFVFNGTVGFAGNVK
ncbi:alpha/beta fold hydrolase [Desulfovibrio sp. JC022]|uniref:alpha/beta fold hydrolase n=1 Tax=Desulfovibrio sp. JC022 TaxID=2593642 RepID=UPI0013D09A01